TERRVFVVEGEKPLPQTWPPFPMSNPLDEYLCEFVSERRLAFAKRVLRQRTRHLTVVLEDFFKPHNASACLRSCDCFGLQDAYITETYYQFKKSQGVTAGAADWMTLYRYSDRNGGRKACFEDLRNRGYQLYAADPAPKGVLVEELDISRPTAILFGSERKGISDEAREAAVGLVRLPMYGFTESFNVSVACALTLSTLARKLFQSDIPWQLPAADQDVLWRKWIRRAVGRTWPRLEREYFKRHPQHRDRVEEWALSSLAKRSSAAYESG
ncbi:MAG: hypothetical protein CMJ46_14990, partial [Planctomyces sp.]|nr:hypothetical protein [Planctomyces sp.]